MREIQFRSSFNAMNSVLNKYPPLRKVSKYKLEFKTKSRVFSGIPKK